MLYVKCYNFSYNMNSIYSKLSTVIGLLSKIHHYVTNYTLCSMYFGISCSILIYSSQLEVYKVVIDVGGGIDLDGMGIWLLASNLAINLPG